MSEGKVTSKGQITIPKAVRERLNLKPGDRVEFVVSDSGQVRLIARNLPFERLAGMLKPRIKGITIEQMNPGSFDDGSI